MFLPALFREERRSSGQWPIACTARLFMIAFLFKAHEARTHQGSLCLLFFQYVDDVSLSLVYVS